MKHSIHSSGRIAFILGLAAVCTFSMSSCKKDPVVPKNNDLPLSTGWLGSDDLDSIPSDINIGFGNANLPSKVDLTQRFPPIGDQGSYGTCVSWAVAYNLKTALEAIDKNLKTNDLSSASRQFSPKDLYLAIPDQSKSGCNGTNFEPALDILLQRGVATMQTSPYTNLGNCSRSLLDPGAATEAGKNKILNYRKIEGKVQTIKTYLAESRPVVFGAFTGRNFMTWRNDAVYTGHDALNTGQHGRHAMVVMGYDDSKGTRGAFRVVNSWGPTWGDSGFIWVDYEFFISKDFLLGAFVASNKQADFDPKDNDVPPTAGNFDLIPWNVGDYPNQQGGSSRDRTLYYNVYNIGKSTLPSSQRWNISYVYYNAFNANDAGILLYDYYTDEMGSKGQSGPLNSGGHGLAGNWWNNIDVPSGQGVAEAASGSSYFEWNYTMPNLSGYYYLVVIADAFRNVNESNESNNYYFLTNQYGGPLYFQNGVFQGLQDNGDTRSARPAYQVPDAQAVLKTPAEISPDMANAYTPAEIMKMIQAKKSRGEWVGRAQTNSVKIK